MRGLGDLLLRPRAAEDVQPARYARVFVAVQELVKDLKLRFGQRFAVVLSLLARFGRRVFLKFRIVEQVVDKGRTEREIGNRGGVLFAQRALFRFAVLVNLFVELR